MNREEFVLELEKILKMTVEISEVNTIFEPECATRSFAKINILFDPETQNKIAKLFGVYGVAKAEMHLEVLGTPRSMGDEKNA